MTMQPEDTSPCAPQPTQSPHFEPVDNPDAGPSAPSTSTAFAGLGCEPVGERSSLSSPLNPPHLVRSDTLVLSSDRFLSRPPVFAPEHSSPSQPHASTSLSHHGWGQTLDTSLNVPRSSRGDRPIPRSSSPSRSRSPSRSPSPAQSHSTSPPPSASSPFASAHSWEDEDEDDTFDGSSHGKSGPSWVRGAPKTTFATLPHEILLQILRHVQASSATDLNQCLTVNNQWCYAALELIWYKPTFPTSRGFDRMISILARSTGQPLTSPLESALARLQLSAHSHLNSVSSTAATVAGPGPVQVADVEMEGDDASADATGGDGAATPPEAPPAPSDGGTPLAPPRSLDLASSSSSSSLTSASVSTTSLSAHEAEPERQPEVMFPYAQYVRRINCCPIGKDLFGPRAEAFRALARCTHLERLTLAGVKNLPDTVLREVLPQFTAMVAIDLTDVSELSDDTLAAIAQTCPRLQGINLTNCSRITSKGVVPLATHCPLLRRVKLGNCIRVDDHAVVTLARNCRHLLEVDLTGCTEVSDTGLAAIWRHTHVLRELKLTACGKLSASGFPAHNAGLVRRTNILPNGIVLDNERDDDPTPLLVHADDDSSEPKMTLLDEDDVTYESAVFSSETPSLYLAPTPIAPRPQLTIEPSKVGDPEVTEDGELPPLDEVLRAPRPPRIFEQLRILDLANCSQLTDPAIEGIINHSPKLRNLVLSKCSLLTDDAIYAISRLGKNLHYLHLGRCEKITDRAVKFLARSCTRLRYIDLAYCPDLTDVSVREIGLNLPKLRRIGLVKVQGLTDAALISLVERHTSLERIHLSYCDRLTVPGVFYAVLKLNKLTHLSLTGVPAFRKKELQRMCRAPPPEFNEHQRATFCVYSGRGVHALRDHLSSLYLVWRRMLVPTDPVPKPPGYDLMNAATSRLYAEAVTACRAVNIALPQEGERPEDALARAARQAAITLGFEHIRIPASKGMPALPPARAPGTDLADPNTVALLMNLLHPSDQPFSHRVEPHQEGPQVLNSQGPFSLPDAPQLGHAPLPGTLQSLWADPVHDEQGNQSTAATRFAQAYRSGWLDADGPAGTQGMEPFHRLRVGLAHDFPLGFTQDDEDEPRMGQSAHTHAQARDVHARDTALALRLLGPLPYGRNDPPPAGAARSFWADVPAVEGSTLRSTLIRPQQDMRADEVPRLSPLHLQPPGPPGTIPASTNSQPVPPQSRAAQWALDPTLVARLDRVLRGEHPPTRPRQ